MRPSMGSVGDAYDNAMCESFFATLECELLDRRRFKTQAEARIAAFVEPELPLQFHEPALGAPREVLARWRQLCWQLMGTTMVSQTDVLLAPVFAWILCAPKYLSGMMTLGELTQASAAFVTVQVAFNWLVDNYQRLSDWRSAVNRVATLLLALDEVVQLDERPSTGQEAEVACASAVIAP